MSAVSQRHVKTSLFMTQLAADFAAKGPLNHVLYVDLYLIPKGVTNVSMIEVHVRHSHAQGSFFDKVFTHRHK